MYERNTSKGCNLDESSLHSWGSLRMKMLFIHGCFGMRWHSLIFFWRCVIVKLHGMIEVKHPSFTPTLKVNIISLSLWNYGVANEHYMNLFLPNYYPHDLDKAIVTRFPLIYKMFSTHSIKACCIKLFSHKHDTIESSFFPAKISISSLHWMSHTWITCGNYLSIFCHQYWWNKALSKIWSTVCRCYMGCFSCSPSCTNWIYTTKLVLH